MCSQSQLGTYLQAPRLEDADVSLGDGGSPGVLPSSELLEVFTAQLRRAFRDIMGVPLTTVSYHGDASRVLLCDYTISQSFTGCLEGVVYLNLSAPMMLHMASQLVVKGKVPATATIADAVCRFVNVLSISACVKCAAGTGKIHLSPPRCHRSTGWNDCIADSRLGVARMSHPGGTLEVCIAERTAAAPR